MNINLHFCGKYNKFLLSEMLAAPCLVVQNLFEKVVEVQPWHKHLLQALQEARIDWMHACGGKGRCTTCRMEVAEGGKHLSPPSAFEQKMQAAGRLGQAERLACQCTAQGLVKVRVPHACKFPHVHYSD